MCENNIYQSIAQRTGGTVLLGVVGPVRTGKSTFIKRFMETLVIPGIEDEFARARALDELPQSASGKTIMTVEPKFIPEDAAEVKLGQGTVLSVRMVDCVGYMVDEAVGQFEDGNERMVTTPWFDHEVTITEAAETGTQKVIREHSTIGIVVTTDGSICGIPRESYLEAEDRVLRELKALGKPFIVLLNCVEPESENAVAIAEKIESDYEVSCLRVNCQRLRQSEISDILVSALQEFPLQAVRICLPEWLEALDNEDPLKDSLYGILKNHASGIKRLRDLSGLEETLSAWEVSEGVERMETDLGTGETALQISFPRSLYYSVISEKSGVPLHDDREMISYLIEMAAVKAEYDRLKQALKDVEEKGYGVVLPETSQLVLEEPQIVRQGGKYGVRLRASAPAIHMMKTEITTEVNPAVGGTGASEEIIGFLLQGFDGDVNRIWESNIFGKPLSELAEEGLNQKLGAVPDNARNKLRLIMQRMVNEGCSNLVCILI